MKRVFLVRLMSLVRRLLGPKSRQKSSGRRLGRSVEELPRR